jgi:3-hydroxyisobutyrate dehydrogenase-like beta-hydroxyacid dehydrogenase
MSRTKVGFIGAGQMGRPMVDRLVAAGWPVEVFARRPEQRTELAAAGIAVSASATDVASRADLVIVCLFSDAQVREVVLDGGVLAAMRPGSVMANHVTGSPDLAVELAAAAPDGVGFLDLPISGTAESIRNGRLTLLVGGDPTLLGRVREPLSAYGDPILEVGGVGDGQRIKLVNNLLFAVHLRVALAGAAVAAELGIAPDQLARVVARCSGDSFAVRLFGQAPPEVFATSARPYLVKDVAVIREVAAASGIDLGRLGELARWVDDDGDPLSA